MTGSDETYRAIKNLIMTGSLPTGVPISQVQLARQLRISRTPVREALRRLQAEGLIEAPFRRRMRVGEVSPAEVDAMFGARIILHAMAVALTVPSMSEDDLRRLRRTLTLLEAAQARGDHESWSIYQHDFHEMLTQHAGDHLRASVADYFQRCDRYRRIYGAVAAPMGPISRREDRALVVAYAARAVEDAVFVASRHLGRAGLALLGTIDPDYAPAAIRCALVQTAKAADRLPQPGTEVALAKLTDTSATVARHLRKWRRAPAAGKDEQP